MIKPKILVVTATLGNRISLDKTIKSVQSIGGTNVQHLIVAPFDKIEQLKSQYDFLWYLAEPKDQKGIYPALNLAFNKYGRDFDYLTFINDDDYWLTDFKVLIDTIIRENYDLVYARTCYVNDADAFISEQSSSGQFKKFIGLLKSSGIVLFTQQATIIKSSLFFEVGGFDETYKLVADSKFWMQLSLMNIKYKYINKVCAAYMLQEGQLSSDHSLQAIEHSRLFDEFPCIKPASFIDVLKFRSINAHIYMKRILKFKKIHNPFFAPPCLMILTLMPWCLKRWCLRHLLHYDIDSNAHIGLAYVYPKYLKMESGARIEHFTVALHLDKIVMGKNAHVGRSNWITGFPTGTNSAHFAHDNLRRCELIIGKETSITKHHHIDCTNSIHIGEYTTIAGYYSQLLTHSIDIYDCRQDSHPITIGDYCFVSTGVKILGGSKLPSYSVLAAGAVLNKQYGNKWKLYAGMPAEPIKEIPHDAKYMTRSKGYVW